MIEGNNLYHGGLGDHGEKDKNFSVNIWGKHHGEKDKNFFVSIRGSLAYLDRRSLLLIYKIAL